MKYDNMPAGAYAPFVDRETNSLCLKIFDGTTWHPIASDAGGEVFMRFSSYGTPQVSAEMLGWIRENEGPLCGKLIAVWRSGRRTL